MRSVYEKLRQAYPGKRIVIAEFGWPSAGLNRKDAVPSPLTQAEVVARFHHPRRRDGHRLFDLHRLGGGQMEVPSPWRMKQRARRGARASLDDRLMATELGDDDALAWIGLAQLLVGTDSMIDGGPYSTAGCARRDRPRRRARDARARYCKPRHSRDRRAPLHALDLGDNCGPRHWRANFVPARACCSRKIVSVADDEAVDVAVALGERDAPADTLWF